MPLEIIVEAPTPLPAIGCVFDGGGIQILPGDKRAPVTVVGDCVITGWRIIGDVSGSVEFDIYRAQILGDLPATDSIVGSVPPSLTAVSSGEGSDVSDWCGGNAELDDGEVLEWSVVSVLNFTQIRIELFRESR